VNYLEKIQEAASFLAGQTEYRPKIGLILGSGLGSLADQIGSPKAFPYQAIPHFPVSTVHGHAGQFVLGDLLGKTVIAMQGRVHYYEGYSMQQITFPVRVMKELGVEILIVTSACGGLNSKLYPSALMFVEDHINYMGDNPLMGENHEELGPRFPDMSTVYDDDLISLGKKAGKKIQVETFTGIHTAVSGPYYLSKAELNVVRNFGSDSIGMSMIPEVIVAAHAGIRVLGIACITDMATPEEHEPLDHATVVEVANKTRPKFIKLVSKIVEDIDQT
jgi:purine-nucleoside phosphorylase